MNHTEEFSKIINNKNKIEKVAGTLDLDYIMVAKKPFKTGFKKVLNFLKTNRLTKFGKHYLIVIIML